VAGAGVDLEGRVFVVAGAGGGGIGTAVCRTLTDAGAQVAGIDIDEERLAAAPCALPLVLDVRDELEVVHAVGRVIDELGPLAGLVHVAGGMQPDEWAPLVSMDPGAWGDVLDLNLSSAFVTSRVAASQLMRQQTGGSIVHIASVVGLSAMPFGAAYAAAKAGLLSLTRTAALEWGPAGIRVNAVAAGTIRAPKNAATSPVDDTPAERAALPLGRRGTPDDVANAVLFFASGLASYVTGQVLAVDGGSSTRPSLLDETNLPVFVHDETLRRRLLS
jgi:NAD(P)-dependent dehydrogenase (short-subunit alcohol dehydrogenase family)